AHAKYSEFAISSTSSEGPPERDTRMILAAEPGQAREAPPLAYKSHEPSELTRAASLSSGPPTRISGEAWSRACLKISKCPFRLEAKMTALLSGVHAKGSSICSSITRSRGVSRDVAPGASCA